MTRVLVTGASGFVGRHCLRCLEEHPDVEVHAVASSSKPTRDAATWHRADLLDAEEVQRLVASIRPSHLLHLAWSAAPQKFWTDPDNLRWVEASLVLVRAFQAGGGERLVVAGSCAEYDWTHGFCSERTTPLVPATLYGASKHALEAVLTPYCASTGLSAAWGRLFFLYGPHESPSRFVASSVLSMLRGEIAKTTHGDQIRDFLHVRDAADALVALLFSGATGPVNVASGDPVRLRSIVQRVATKLRREDRVALGALPAPTNEPPMVVADIRRLAREVGWTPQLSLDDGLESTIDWWRDHLSDASPPPQPEGEIT